MAKSNSISIEDYQKIDQVRSLHNKIRLGLVLIIVIAVVAMVYNFFRQIEQFPVAEYQAATLQELAPLAPELRRAAMESYRDNQDEIHANIQTVLEVRQPDLRDSFERETAIFVSEFPERISETLDVMLAEQVEEYLAIINERYPELAERDDFEEFMQELFAEAVLEASAAVEADINQIGESLQTVHEITQSPKIKSEIELLRQEDDINEQFLGIALRMWAREYPGARVNFTIGDVQGGTQ